jgi:hypothetical protein
MSGVIGTLTKQPGEVKNIDFDFADWLADKSDTIASVDVVSSVPAELVVEETNHANGVVRAIVSGGEDDTDYVVTATITTARAPTALVEEAEVIVKVRETPAA